MQHSEVIRKVIEITEQDDILYGLFQNYGNEEFAAKNVRQNRQTINMSFNGFIYEAKIKGQAILEFISVRYADRFSFEEDQYLKKIRNNFYGLFEIVAVDYGSGLTLRDVRTENIYKIAEHKGALGTTIGTLIFCRLADMGGSHIILYHDLAIGAEEAYSVKRTFRATNIPLSTAKIAQLFFEENEFTNEDGSFINPEKQLIGKQC